VVTLEEVEEVEEDDVQSNLAIRMFESIAALGRKWRVFLSILARQSGRFSHQERGGCTMDFTYEKNSTRGSNRQQKYGIHMGSPGFSARKIDEIEPELVVLKV